MSLTLRALDLSCSSAEGSPDLIWVPTAKQAETLARVNYTCECCGIVSKPHKKVPSGYMEIITYPDGTEKVLCAICATTQVMGRPLLNKSGNEQKVHGIIFYNSDLTQAEYTSLAIDSISHKLLEIDDIDYYNSTSASIQGNMCDNLKDIHPMLEHGDVEEFIELYSHLSPQLRENDDQIFGHLRFWPSDITFHKVISFWLLAGHEEIVRLKFKELENCESGN